jgi:hypothetical protein
MKKHYAPIEAVASDARDLESCVTAEIIRVYLASEVDELLDRIQIEARQQSPFTMSSINRLIIKARLADQVNGDP